MSKTDAASILIGGAEGHLGRHAVRFFARAGLKVAGSCRTAQDLARMQDFVRTEGLRDVTLLQCDLGDEAAVEAAVAEADRRVGGLDAVFNAAGGFRWAAAYEMAAADFDFLMTSNVRSAFMLAKAAVPGMKARGFGRIVFVSSRATLGTGDANLGVYAASKAAVNALTLGLAAELKKTGVTVNAVLPTTIDTPPNRQAMAGADFSEWVTPEQLCEVVRTLVSKTGAPVNGALLPVAGKL